VLLQSCARTLQLRGQRACLGLGGLDLHPHARTHAAVSALLSPGPPHAVAPSGQNPFAPSPKIGYRARSTEPRSRPRRRCTGMVA
jgi:hypothetical protein